MGKLRHGGQQSESRHGAHTARLAWQGEEEDVERRGGTADGDTPLSTRLRVTAHWLLWLAGKGLAILLLALAGGYGTGGDMR